MVSALVICSTGRSGSGLLCSALAETGLAGRPDEFFGPRTRAEYAAQWDAATDAEYVDAMLAHGTTPNGVFAVKIHWEHLSTAIATLRSTVGGASPLDALAPRVHYVWLRRRDTVRQAVSEFRAGRGGGYVRLDARPHVLPTRPEFDYEAIRRLVERFTRSDEGWARYFAERGLAPATLVYEDDLEHAYEPAVRRVLALAGVTAPPGLAIRSPFRKQSDDWSEALVARYRACDPEAPTARTG